MSDNNKMTITLPRAVMTALERAGRPYDMSAPEYVKFALLCGLTQPEGMVLKLEMPPKLDDTSQPALPGI